MGQPFADCAMPEVCARIIYRCIERTYRQRSQNEMSGQEAAILVVDSLDNGKGTLLHSCALAAFYHIVRGGKLLSWRDTAILHSRAGLGFRRCWYDDYKANRRDPRVTNRGVKRSLRSPAVERDSPRNIEG